MECEVLLRCTHRTREPQSAWLTTLVSVFPGVDPRRDVVEASLMKIVLPVGGVGAVPVVPPEIVGGAGFAALLEKALRGPLAAL